MTKPTGRPRGRPRKHPIAENTTASAPSVATAISVDEELAEVEADIVRLQGERDEGAALTWTKGITVEEAEAAERRRSLAQRLIDGANVRRLEIRRKGYERELEPLEAEREAAGRRLEEIDAERAELQRQRGSVLSALSETESRIWTLQRRIAEASREIRELRGEG